MQLDIVQWSQGQKLQDPNNNNNNIYIYIYILLLLLFLLLLSRSFCQRSSLYRICLNVFRHSGFFTFLCPLHFLMHF
jgi:hypothetical protein